MLVDFKPVRCAFVSGKDVEEWLCKEIKVWSHNI